MILEVPFECFASEVQSRLHSNEVYAAAHGSGTMLTAADAPNDILLVCRMQQAFTEAFQLAADAGLSVKKGCWVQDLASLEALRPDGARSYVAAVAYVSRDSKPGVWMDAYPLEPTPAQVLQELYNEFQNTGEMPGVTFEHFLRLAQPNVEMLSPDQAERFASRKV